MQVISFWTEVKEVYADDGLILIIGRYNHKDENQIGDKCLGIHWGDFPQSRGILSPCVVPPSTRDAILAGLLHQAVIDKKSDVIKKLMEAIEYFKW
jgi:hypothetical protein